MKGPEYGAIGATFKTVRMMQAICLIAIIGMTANFISEMVQSQQTPPSVLVGTLSVTCIAVLYCGITYVLLMDDSLPFLINAGMDSMLLIAVIVVSVVVGKPLSYLDCQVIGSANAMSSAYDFTTSLGANIDQNGGYITWVGASKSSCLEMKAVWGLSIAMCILFALSSISSIILWRRKSTTAPKKDVEDGA